MLSTVLASPVFACLYAEFYSRFGKLGEDMTESGVADVCRTVDVDEASASGDVNDFFLPNVALIRAFKGDIASEKASKLLVVRRRQNGASLF